MNGRRYVLGQTRGQVLVLSTAHAFNHIFLIFFTPLLLSIGDAFQVDLSHIGALVGAALAAYSFGALPAGFLADKLGSRRMIILSLALPAVGYLLASAARSFSLLAAAFLIIGVGAGLYHPSGFAMLSVICSEEDRGKYMGLHGAGGNTGMILAPFLTVALTSYWGWRGAFAFCGSLSLLIAALAVPVLKAPERTKQMGNSGTGTSSRPTITASLLWILGLSGFHGVVYNGSFNLLPTYLQSNLKQAFLLSGIFTALMYGSGIVGQILGGYWTDHHGRWLPLYVGTVGAILGLCALPVAYSLPVLLCTLSVLGISFFLLQPAMAALLADHSREDRRGLSYGLFFSVQNGLGALGVFLAGLLADRYGLGSVFFSLGVVASVALLVTFFLAKRPSQRV